MKKKMVKVNVSAPKNHDYSNSGASYGGSPGGPINTPTSSSGKLLNRFNINPNACPPEFSEQQSQMSSPDQILKESKTTAKKVKVNISKATTVPPEEFVYDP